MKDGNDMLQNDCAARKTKLKGDKNKVKIIF
jgi:hypothetical protein